MCAITGAINIGGNRPLDKKTIIDTGKAMQVQKHRGPDDQCACAFSFLEQSSNVAPTTEELARGGEFYNGILGFNRLSIKDLSLAGRQPMTGANGKVILVFNGEIYNDTELRAKLIYEKHCVFKGSSDTEVVLNLYLEYGFEIMVKNLNGMFAIAIVDLRNSSIYLARDRFGIKPFYYTLSNNQLLFASELKGIVQFSHFKKELDIDACNSRLMSLRSESVLLKNVKQINPGHVIRIDAQGNSFQWKFFDLDDYTRDDKKYKDIGEAIEDCEAVIKDAVSRQMISDVRVGCQLSGGIDSSLVTYFANQMKTGNLNDAVSIVAGDGSIGEEKYIDQIGNSLGLELHKFRVTTDYFADNYEKMIWHYDAPAYSPFFCAFKRLAQGAKDCVTVLLSGEGSDEIAGGYTRFSAGVYQPFITTLLSGREARYVGGESIIGDMGGGNKIFQLR